MTPQTPQKAPCGFCAGVVLMGCASPLRAPDGWLRAARWVRICDRCEDGRDRIARIGVTIGPVTYKS